MAARGADRRRARGRPARARARDLARRERRPARVSARPRALPRDGPRCRHRRHRAAGRRQVVAHRARSSRTSAGSSGPSGVVSVDPSSPFSRGALLGDRIRLSEHFLDPGVYIRSMGSRGHLGGLAETTLQAVLLLDASGKDVVFVETVGAGQSDVEVTGIADTRPARAHAGIGRLRPGAEGGDHGDPGRDRDQQDGSPGGEDDAERGAVDRAARPSRTGVRPSSSPRRSAARTSPSCGRAREASGRPRAATAASRSAAGATSPPRCSRSRRAARRRTWSRRCAGDPELERLLDAVQRRELDPLTAVQEIMEKVFHVRSEAEDQTS